MPVPNDFRLSGALGGLVASQEYQAEQERQALQNLQTQAATAQTQQATAQAQQLLPCVCIPESCCSSGTLPIPS